MRDPFETLGLDATFDLAAEQVEGAYLARVAAVHPDLAASDPERASEAARLAAALNTARRVLSDPEGRARALLDRLGVPESRDLPEGFLLEMMETRLAIEEAARAGDTEQVARWRGWAAAARGESVRQIGSLFNRVGSGEPQDDLGREIRRQLNAWRYIERLIEQLPGPG
ncbi:MAG: hypothetical protein IPJ41_08850 [Phycisphaerales bacterium]|nr:hypothetical protein [Phycisphaerales bacterium]